EDRGTRGSAQEGDGSTPAGLHAIDSWRSDSAISSAALPSIWIKVNSGWIGLSGRYPNAIPDGGLISYHLTSHSLPEV
ncbi:MAG TPA: hypothetical protein VF944_07000, partial [Candidatus Bathyarchaeia archaeon]